MGYFWAAITPADRWLYEGRATINRLLELVREHVRLLVESGIFTVLPRPSDETDIGVRAAAESRE